MGKQTALERKWLEAGKNASDSIYREIIVHFWKYVGRTDSDGVIGENMAIIWTSQPVEVRDRLLQSKWSEIYGYMKNIRKSLDNLQRAYFKHEAKKIKNNSKGIKGVIEELDKEIGSSAAAGNITEMAEAMISYCSSS